MSTSTMYSESAHPAHAAAATRAQADEGSRKKVTKRRKVSRACLYCRRSHMTCDEGRPCQRCIKREIGHLCRDEQRPKPPNKEPTTPGGVDPSLSQNLAPVLVHPAPRHPHQSMGSPWSMTAPQNEFLYQPETLGNEFTVLRFAPSLPPSQLPPHLHSHVPSSDFLRTLDEGGSFVSSPPNTNNNNAYNTSFLTPSTSTSALPPCPPLHPDDVGGIMPSTPMNRAAALLPAGSVSPIVIPLASKTERFLLTAAHQESGSRTERLDRVIRSKYEAGLLKPYNYVKGYARLSRWMDTHVSQESKEQILQPLSVLRPKFRAVAQSLKDLDLVFIEEAFERLLLDYDRVFAAMGVPACLWRRTGEIYKANREFEKLVGLDGHMMRDGRLCIYELMAEESAVNYWEKYGHVAFDAGQKAVLTSCVLRYKPRLGFDANSSRGSGSGSHSNSNSGAGAGTGGGGGTVTKGGGGTGGGGGGGQEEEGFVNCCFSFTIRRDRWGMPTMIVGNFIRC
ncbi:hypothetical protein D9615_006300 [Tricholomella constricta]|uniref:Zn(2)-C6 fungal-type domain-containing protein n=1 Tax=Tricholomella constricta TaxID=117010 RepID=A0A8H5HBG5_9AGAR|nr:hypothetical protein D9615_006300 [Tricholomella constricta]